MWSKNSNGLKWRGLGFAQALCLNGLLRPRNSGCYLAFTKYRLQGNPRCLAIPFSATSQQFLELEHQLVKNQRLQVQHDSSKIVP